MAGNRTTDSLVSDAQDGDLIVDRRRLWTGPDTQCVSNRMKELIAIGPSVTANCVPCLRHHLKKAREAGVDKARMYTAVSIGRMVRKGAESDWDEEAENLLGSIDSAISKEKKGRKSKAVEVSN